MAGAVPVLVDGGVRRGTDVFKALALGATAVMVRPDPCRASNSCSGPWKIPLGRRAGTVENSHEDRIGFALQVGRPVFYGLAARGEAGARHVIEMLNRELELTMALCGCRSVAEVTRRHVLTEGDRIRALL